MQGFSHRIAFSKVLPPRHHDAEPEAEPFEAQRIAQTLKPRNPVPQSHPQNTRTDLRKLIPEGKVVDGYGPPKLPGFGVQGIRGITVLSVWDVGLWVLRTVQYPK